jgi:hypothetical protein
LYANYAGQTVSASVTVTPPASLYGTVTDQNLVPIADATVLIQAPIQILPPGGDTLQLSTNADGYFESPILPIATYTVNASQGGYLQSADQTAQIGFGQPSAELNFVLVATEAYIVQGYVTSDIGNAVAGARVQLNASSPVPSSITTTDDDGFYTLTAEPDPIQSSYTCFAEAAGYADRYLTLTIANGANITQNIELDRLGAASGVVTGPQGQPVAYAQLRGSGQAAWSDANGHYTLTGLDPGSSPVTVSAAGFDSLAALVPIAPGATTPQNFVLTAATAIIQGTIDDESGDPVPGAAITTGMQRAVSDANGFYQLAPVAAGTVSLFVVAPRCVAERRSVAVADGQTLVEDFTLGPLHPPTPFPQ